MRLTDRNGPDVEYLRAVRAFHEPNTPPSTCMWCGLPSPCGPYLQAQAALASLTDGVLPVTETEQEQPCE